MPLIHHNLVLQASAAYVLALLVAESAHHEVVFLRQYHKFHAFLPVTQAKELEVLANEIGRLVGFLFLRGFLSCFLRGLSLLRTLGLYNIRGLCHCTRHNQDHADS